MYAPARPPLMAAANTWNTVKLSRALQSLADSSRAAHTVSCASCGLTRSSAFSNKRSFTSSPQSHLKEVFPPPKNAPHIKITPPVWHHPVYTMKQMEDIKVAHRKAKNWSDWVAITAMRFLRWGMDTATGYSHPSEAEKKKGSYMGLSRIKSWAQAGPMTERKWLIRFLFLESVAGVPGMVAASIRHLHSLRRLKRDNGWIETLLEEAYNERMHLLTFMKMAEPGVFMKLMILGAQGVFYNGLFVSYLISPRICHRFVGHLEEEAVLTYTRVLQDLDAGRLPKWEKMEIPELAIRYWNMPEEHRTMRDLLLYIRADEAKHREVNHTLANLEQNDDPNPFVSEYINPIKPHPTKGIENIKPTGWDREEAL